jgi:hypothetical protein
MVDYVIRPLAGLLLCLAIGAVILCLPYVIRVVTARVHELRAARRSEPGPDATLADDVAEETRANASEVAANKVSKGAPKDSAA